MAIIGHVVTEVLDHGCQRMILIAPGWPNMPWFWDLVNLSAQIPLSLPKLENPLTQPFNECPHSASRTWIFMLGSLSHSHPKTRLLWPSGSKNWGSSEAFNQKHLWVEVVHFCQMVWIKSGRLQVTLYTTNFRFSSMLVPGKKISSQALLMAIELL